MFDTFTFTELLTGLSTFVAPIQDVLIAAGFLGAIGFAAWQLKRAAK